MRIAHLFTWYRFIVACLLATAIAPPLAANSGIALVDLSSVMDRNERLRQSLGDLKSDVLSFREQTLVEQKRLAIRESQLPGWPGSSPLHQREQMALARQTAALRAKVEAHQEQFLDREAQAYAKAYERSMEHLEQHCKQRKLAGVMRYHGRQLAGEPSRPLVLGQNVDLTQPITASLNAESRSKTLLGFPRDKLPEPVRQLSKVPENALKSAATARAAWALDQLVFPPAS